MRVRFTAFIRQNSVLRSDNVACLSNYLENAIMNHIFRNTAYTSPTALYIALFTTDPTDAGTGTEVSGGGYARQSIAFGEPSNGEVKNSADITFPAATESWGTVSYWGIYDNSSGGNFLAYGAFSNPSVNQHGRPSGNSTEWAFSKN